MWGLLIRRSCPPSSPSPVDANIAAAGGKNVFIYNNAGEFTELSGYAAYKLTAAFLYADVGASLVALSGSAALVSATNTALSSIAYSTGGKISSYSTYGPK